MLATQFRGGANHCGSTFPVGINAPHPPAGPGELGLVEAILGVSRDKIIPGYFINWPVKVGPTSESFHDWPIVDAKPESPTSHIIGNISLMTRNLSTSGIVMCQPSARDDCNF